MLIPFLACSSIVSQELVNYATAPGTALIAAKLVRGYIWNDGRALIPDSEASRISDGNPTTGTEVSALQMVLPRPRKVLHIVIFAQSGVRLTDLQLQQLEPALHWTPVRVPPGKTLGPKMVISVPGPRKISGVRMTFVKKGSRRDAYDQVRSKIYEVELWGLADPSSNDSTEDHMERDLIERMMKDLNRPSP